MIQREIFYLDTSLGQTLHHFNFLARFVPGGERFHDYGIILFCCFFVCLFHQFDFCTPCHLAFFSKRFGAFGKGFMTLFHFFQLLFKLS